MVTGMFSFYQESKSSKIMESFNQMLPERTKVIRDSETRELNVTELVVGDIVLVETGDRIPADIRILECQGHYDPQLSCFYFSTRLQFTFAFLYQYSLPSLQPPSLFDCFFSLSFIYDRS